MDKKIVTFKEAISDKVYSTEFTGHDGIHHVLEAECSSADDSILDLPAVWSVMDSCRRDGMVKTYGKKDEDEMGSALMDIEKKISADFPGIEIYFDYADQAFIQA